MPENTDRKQAGRFKSGQSGNPAGRPRGSRNATTVAVEALLDGEAEELTRKAVEMAKEGDMQAIRICLDRIIPPRKDRPISFNLPSISGPGDVATAMAAILAAVSSGAITPSEASDVAKLVDKLRQGRRGNRARGSHHSIGEDAAMNRSLETRVERLEGRAGGEGSELLFMVWCDPEDDVCEKFEKALASGLIASGSKMWPSGAAACCRGLAGRDRLAGGGNAELKRLKHGSKIGIWARNCESGYAPQRQRQLSRLS